jgi:hypothetical protein
VRLKGGPERRPCRAGLSLIVLVRLTQAELAVATASACWSPAAISESRSDKDPPVFGNPGRTMFPRARGRVGGEQTNPLGR